MPSTLQVTADTLPQQWLDTAVDLLRAGGVVLYPTETFYGLGCRCDDRAALQRIYRIKQRAATQPLLLLVAGTTMLGQVADSVSDAALALAGQWWPGPLTLLLPARPGLPASLVGPGNTVGCRQSSCPTARAMVERPGCPLTSTSANLSGERPPVSISMVSVAVRSAVDLIIDAGTTPGGAPSTIVDTTRSPHRIVRHGAITVG